MFIMKNLLITGGCGFIGSNFINNFFETSTCNIVNIDAMYYCANETNVNAHIRNSSRYKLIKGNLCSFDLVRHVLECYSIDAVIHFAAQSHVQNSFEDSLQYTNDNVVGTHTLLECARRYGKIDRFIHISTDEVYGESMLEENECKKSEESILCPTNPYAASKAAAELIAKSYYHSFQMPIIITRPIVRTQRRRPPPIISCAPLLTRIICPLRFLIAAITMDQVSIRKNSFRYSSSSCSKTSRLQFRAMGQMCAHFCMWMMCVRRSPSFSRKG